MNTLTMTRTCLLPECGQVPRSTNSLWCELHRLRIARHGDPRYVQPKSPGHITACGYWKMSGYKGHPLATPAGQILEHGLVLFEAIGDGSHPCHWCHCEVTWGVDLVTDHLDHDRLNNASGNLVPSCHPCNASRERRAPKVV